MSQLCESVLIVGRRSRLGEQASPGVIPDGPDSEGDEVQDPTGSHPEENRK